MPTGLRDNDPPFGIFIAFSALLGTLYSICIKPERYFPSIIEGMSNVSLTHETTLLSEGLDSFSVISESDQESENPVEYDSALIATNNLCCAIVLVFKITQILVFGTLRVSEKHILKETFWDHFFHKSLVIFSIIDTGSYKERLNWVVWFTALGLILILAQLCRNRFDYLTSSPTTKRWYLVKIYILMGLLLAATIFCAAVVRMHPFTSRTIFLLSDISYLLIYLTAVVFRFLILTYDMRTNNVWESRNSVIYYSDLFFTMAMFSIEFLHNMYLVVAPFAPYVIKIWFVMKMTAMVEEVRKRYRKHRSYINVIQMVELSFPAATKRELEQNRDDCAICWDEMVSARKLPCGHLFHRVCLRSWLEQDTSCPVCRKSVKDPPGELERMASRQVLLEEEFENLGLRPASRNHFFHFDSSRYTNHPFLSWLPTISIEGFV